MASESRARKRPKGYAPWSPQLETLKLVGQARAVLQEYRVHLPMTARQVFYRLVGVYDYPKDERAYERLCNALGRARRSGFIPFDHLRDDGASVMESRHYENPEGFYGYLRQLGEGYERDKLANQDVDMRVYCEAAGMMPQLHRVCTRYSVPVYSCSGFDSLTAKHQLARHCAETFTYEGKATVILHLGDLDPSGVSIYESMKEDVLAFVSEDVPYNDPEDVAIFCRLALKEYQQRFYDLPTAPPKKSDGRSKRWAGETCQLEALPPNTLARIVEMGIEHFLDTDTLNENREAEQQERRKISYALPSGDEPAEDEEE